MKLQFALLGNPNSGKTTLFNTITGSRARVGNWPGVTVEQKVGKYKKNGIDLEIVDLPGIYSMSPYSEDEIVARDFVIHKKPQLIINIVDATNIDRNLYLTTQLMQTGVPIVIALNMMDQLESDGGKINSDELQRRLNVPVVPISASKNRGIDKLLDAAISFHKENKKNEPIQFGDKSIYEITLEIQKLLESSNENSTFFIAEKILEGEESLVEYIKGKNLELYNKIESKITESKLREKYSDLDIVMAENRYKFIESVTKSCVDKPKQFGEAVASDKIDKILTNKYLALPIFIALILTVFQITFGPFGSFLADTVDEFLHETFTESVEEFLVSSDASDLTISLITDGIIPGVGMILVFLPQILLLFFFISILEDSGYMARAAFVMDKLLVKIGLSGKAFVPILMGFGCSVPAIMATRTLENERNRRLAIILTPFMSCGARLPVYAVFVGAFFATGHQTMVIFSLYMLGVLVAIISAFILKNTVLKGETPTFIMELPPYRMPIFKNLMIHIWEKAKGFAKRAGLILLPSAIIIWFLQGFDMSFQLVEDQADSIFGNIGIFLTPIFEPLGFGEWRASVALLTGFIAKEAVVGTLGILYGVGESGSLSGMLQEYFTPVSAYAYMAFVLLYMPCIVAFATIQREMNSWKWTLFTVVFQTGVAWTVSLIIYQVGNLIFT